MAPRWGRSRPVMQRRMVDLPEPEGPTMVTASPRRTCTSMPLSTWLSPKDRCTSCRWTRAGAVPDSAEAALCTAWVTWCVPALPDSGTPSKGRPAAKVSSPSREAREGEAAKPLRGSVSVIFMASLQGAGGAGNRIAIGEKQREQREVHKDGEVRACHGVAGDLGGVYHVVHARSEERRVGKECR